jgi:hypothetical protein
MRYFLLPILTAALGLVLLTMPSPAAATTKDQAKAMCSKRGAQCTSFGLGDNSGNDIILCVDNRSSGNGVQCVRCQGNNPCAVLREAPGSERVGLSEVDTVLTESMRPADVGALEERIRTLEERLKALESATK